MTPKAKRVITVIVPPELMRGKGIPVAGIKPVFVPIFIKISKSIFITVPMRIIERNESSELSTETTKPRIRITEYKKRRSREPTNPNSSAKDAYMKSV